MSFEDVLSNLSSSTRKKVLDAKALKLVRVPTASYGVNKALGGGIGRGRITTWWGSKSSGKSILCYQTMALAQQRGEVCLLIDSEDSYDPEWAARLGVDVDHLLVVREKAISDVTDIVAEHINAGVEVVVIDSISALVPASFYEKDGEMKNQENTGQMGALSKGIGSMLKILNAVNRGRCDIHLISQMRNKISTVGAIPAPEGGEALKFYSSVIVKLWSNASEAKQIKETKKVGNRSVTTNIGRPVNWTIEFSKTSEPNVFGSYDLYYRGDSVGIDSTGEIVELALSRGVMENSGAWVKYNGESKYKKDWKLQIQEDEVLKKELLEALND